MIGNIYGRLTVLEYHHSDKKYNKFYTCKCACGNTAIIRGSNLTNNKTKSCGCYAEEFRKTLEDTAKIERRNITKNSYKIIIDRCYDPSNRHYMHFGGVGITVCDRWRFGENGKTGWECFFEDMGPKPRNYILGRKDKLGPFNKDNCKWTTSNNQFADIMRSGRPRVYEKETVELSEQDSWIRRCLIKPNRKGLSAEYIKSIWQTHCPLLEVELAYTPEKASGTTRNYATLDRIDPNKGYVEGNVQIVCQRANTLKNDASLSELSLLVKNLAKIVG